MQDQNQWQQGDVVGFRVDSIPKGARRVEPENGVYILARGEATGHHHAVEAQEGVSFWLLEKDGAQELYADVQVSDVPVTHQEHKPARLLHGTQRVAIVREVDHLQEMERRVID